MEIISREDPFSFGNSITNPSKYFDTGVHLPPLYFIYLEKRNHRYLTVWNETESIIWFYCLLLTMHVPHFSIYFLDNKLCNNISWVISCAVKVLFFFHPSGFPKRCWNVPALSYDFPSESAECGLSGNKIQQISQPLCSLSEKLMKLLNQTWTCLEWESAGKVIHKISNSDTLIQCSKNILSQIISLQWLLTIHSRQKF